jgi:multidrug resistance efflux pump
MSSNLMRLGAMVGSATLLAVAVASAQDRKTGEASGRGSVAVFNSVEDRTTVLTIRPDGTHVEKGEIVCQLDPAELRDRQVSQEVAVRGAQADAHSARLDREVAEIAVVEYKQGIFVQDLATVQGEIKLAESDEARALDRVDWARRMFNKGFVTIAEKIGEELMLKKAIYAKEQAQSKLKVLLEYTKNKTIKELESEVEWAKARELAKQAALERAQFTQKKLADQIKRCTIAAPAAGRVQYAAPIGAGAVIHDGQLLFRIVPEGTPEAKAK